MNPILRKSLFYVPLLSIIIVSSCQKENNLYVETQVDENVIEYGSLKVKLPINYNESVLTLKLEDLQNHYFLINSKKLKSNSISDRPDITMEELNELASAVLLKYPDMGELSESDILLIQENFNGIPESTIYKNIELIDSFYSALIRFDYFDTISKYIPIQYKSANDYFGYNVSFAELWALAWHPSLVGPTMDATNKAIELTGQYFPTEDPWRTKADAFRHAMWNVLIAKYVGDKKNSIEKCVSWAKKFTDKHEEGADKPEEMTQDDFDFDQSMDFHNNEYGRNCFSSVAWEDERKWYQSTVVYAPSETTMANYIFGKTGLAKKVSSETEINSYPLFLVYIKD
ncbi:MAG: hypothetical protein ACERKD_03125 [Prolixibacteraceae bacterium]